MNIHLRSMMKQSPIRYRFHLHLLLFLPAVMKPQDAPGTTFKKHMDIAHGLLSEDDYLLTEILFNPHTPEQVSQIQEQLDILLDIIKRKDTDKMKAYLTRLRENIR